MGPPTATIYTRAGCHLCEQAGLALTRHGFAIQWIDIDSDEQLRDRFDHCVPVVEMEGRIRFRGRVNEVLLRRLVRGRAARFEA